MKSSGTAHWKRLAMALGHDAEQAIDDVKRRFARRFRSHVPLHIIAFRGFGNTQRATLSARVLEYRAPLDTDPDALWTRLRESYRRFETDEVANARVTLIADDVEYETTTDEEGYAHFELELAGQDLNEAATPTLLLPDHRERHEPTRGHIHFADPQARFGVISDIDDTILVTEATSIVKMMRLTLLSSSQSRVAFPGAACLYRALRNTSNPFFYVSSSPWNLYEFLSDFMALHEFPTGPLMLRDFGFDGDVLVAGSHADHKLEQVRRVLDMNPTLPFIVIGDSGQDDPVIYAQIAEEYPGRILACYIRDVTDVDGDARVDGLAHRFEAVGVPLLRAADSLAVARDAHQRGWMDAADVDAVSAALVSPPTTPDEA